jgi:hypothetical protein
MSSQIRLQTAAAFAAVFLATGAFAQSTLAPPSTDKTYTPMGATTPAAQVVTPVQQAQSAKQLDLVPARSKRVLVPRTGSAVPSGISGVSGSGNYSGGRSNGINDGADPSRSSGGAGGAVSNGSLGSKPLTPRDDTPRRKL